MARKQARARDQHRRLKYKKGEEPLLSAGGSYGTDLGQVFASMQPHRVKRMFLDGIDNTEYDISGASLTSLWDADQIMDNCFEDCALAGSDKCVLYNGPSARDTQTPVFDILGDIEQNGPIYVSRHGTTHANVVTMSDILNNACIMLYSPVTDFEA